MIKGLKKRSFIVMIITFDYYVDYSFSKKKTVGVVVIQMGKMNYFRNSIKARLTQNAIWKSTKRK